MRRRILVTALVGAAFGCNLVLGVDEGSPRAAETTNDASDENAPVRVAPSKCRRDSDCQPPNACYSAHCDTVLGACTYVECEAKDRACAVSACDRATLQCGAPTDYGFRAATIRVDGATLGCGTHPDTCAAAVYPFVFLGTRDALVAARVDSLSAARTTPVPIAHAPFRPDRLVASGRRLFALGAVQGTQAPYELPITMIEVPSDPTVPSLDAVSTVLAIPFSGVDAFPAPEGRLFVVANDATLGLPAAIVPVPMPPAGDIAIVNPYGDAGADGAPMPLPPPVPTPAVPMYRAATMIALTTIAAASGDRLVALRGPYVSLLTGAGTDRVAQTAESGISPPYYSLATPHVTQGPDGTALLGVPINLDGATPSGPACSCKSSSRLYWLFGGAEATTYEPNVAVDVESYENPQVMGGACHVCTGSYFGPRPLVAWVDAKTALVAAPASEARTATAVRVVTRDPLPPTATQRRMVTSATEDPPADFATSRVALTSAAGYGYLVVADADGNKPTIAVLDPRCSPR